MFKILKQDVRKSWKLQKAIILTTLSLTKERQEIEFMKKTFCWYSTISFTLCLQVKWKL